MNGLSQTLPETGHHANPVSASPVASHQAARTLREDERTRRRFFRSGAAVLCAMGLLVVAVTLWLSPDAGLRAAAKNGVPFGSWVLQVLITGNLAVGLLWVGLDWRAWRRGAEFAAERGSLSTVALLVMGGITFFCLVLGGKRSSNDILGMALCLASPTLAVLLPLLWLTVRRLESVRLGTLILVGFVAASGLVQGRVGDSPATDGENLFVMNSCLIGLAVAVWLLAWAGQPEATRCSAGWQPAVSPTGSRLAEGTSQPQRITNPRYSRLPVCATVHWPGDRPISELESMPRPPRTP
jgi:uncharacterized membrane protein YhaH (DUF805 family)